MSCFRSVSTAQACRSPPAQRSFAAKSKPSGTRLSSQPMMAMMLPKTLSPPLKSQRAPRRRRASCRRSPPRTGIRSVSSALRPQRFSNMSVAVANHGGDWRPAGNDRIIRRPENLARSLPADCHRAPETFRHQGRLPTFVYHNE